jgi:hypothetical protein
LSQFFREFDELNWQQQKIIKDSHTRITELEEKNAELESQLKDYRLQDASNMGKKEILNQLIEKYFRDDQYNAYKDERLERATAFLESEPVVNEFELADGKKLFFNEESGAVKNLLELQLAMKFQLLTFSGNLWDIEDIQF